MRGKVLFLDSVHPLLEERLSAAGFVCEHEYHSPHDDICRMAGEYTGLVIRSRIPVDAKLLEAAAQLKFIARSGAGLENIDLEAAAAHGVVVVHSPEGNRDAVGEHALGMLLMLLNGLHKADAEVKHGVWNREGNRGRELNALTVGIIGYGHMGSAFAEKLAGMGCQVIAHDKYKTGFARGHVREVSIDEIYRGADVVSIHLPLSEETFHYVSELFINNMSRPFYLINTARGQHVDTAALVKGLQSGKITGACLDVLEYEPRSFEAIDFEQLPAEFRYLAGSSQVVLSPHVAGWTVESYAKLAGYLADKVLALGI